MGQRPGRQACACGRCCDSARQFAIAQKPTPPCTATVVVGHSASGQDKGGGGAMEAQEVCPGSVHEEALFWGPRPQKQPPWKAPAAENRWPARGNASPVERRHAALALPRARVSKRAETRGRVVWTNCAGRTPQKTRCRHNQRPFPPLKTQNGAQQLRIPQHKSTCNGSSMHTATAHSPLLQPAKQLQTTVSYYGNRPLLSGGGGGVQGGFLVRSLVDGAGSYSVAHRAGLLPTELTGMWGWILLRSPHQGRGSPPVPAPPKQKPVRQPQIRWAPKQPKDRVAVLGQGHVSARSGGGGGCTLCLGTT